MFSSPNEKKTVSVSEDQDADEIDTTSEAKWNEEQKATLVAYDPVSERYILKTSEGHKMIAGELFSKLDKDLKVYADGLVYRFQSCELFWQDKGDVFMRGHQPGGADDQLSVERISVHDLKGSWLKFMKTKDKPILTDIGQI